MMNEAAMALKNLHSERRESGTGLLAGMANPSCKEGRIDVAAAARRVCDVLALSARAG